MAGRRAAQVGIGRERVLRLGHAHRQMAVAGLFPGVKLVAHALVGDRLRAAIDALHDGVDLVEQRHGVGIERRELRRAGFGQRHHLVRQLLDAGRALRPVLAQDRLLAHRGDIVLQRLDLGWRVGMEMVDGHHRRHAELLHVLDVAAEIGAALLHRLDVFRAEVLLLDAAIHLHRPHGGHDHRRRRLQPGLAALDVEELFRPEIGAEAGFGDDIVGKLQRRRGGDHRIAAMRDVGERAAMHEGRIVLQRLHQVRLHRVLEQHGHGARRLEVARKHRRLVAAVGDDDVAEALFEVLEIVGQAQDRHHFRGHRDVEAGLARIAVGDAAERGDDLAQRPVVHVHDAPPDDAAGVDALVVAPVDVVVDQRRQKVVRRGDGVEVAGEVQVHVVHRHDLRQAAAGRTPLHAEIGAERGFADADHGLLADAVEPVAEADRRGGLAFAGRRRVDGGDQDQLAGLVLARRGDEFGRHLRLVMAIGQQMLGRDAELAADLLDRLLLRSARNLDVGFHFGHVFCLR